MSVHVGELHTDIRPAEPGQGSGVGDDRSGGGRTAQEAWEQTRVRLDRLETRTAATGFDD